MEIILARHGETEWNVVEVFRGRVDIGLNETGVRQAELLAGYLSDVRLDAVYASPLKRALHTAEIIAGRQGINVNITPGIIDCDFGEWQGLALKEVEDKFRELYTEWANHPERVRFPGGESLDDVKRRALAVVDDVIARYKGTVALVSHRVVNKVLICALLGLDNSHFWNIRQDTCGVTVFSCEDGRYVLTRHNDTSHLKPVRREAPGDF